MLALCSPRSTTSRKQLKVAGKAMQDAGARGRIDERDKSRFELETKARPARPSPAPPTIPALTEYAIAQPTPLFVLCNH